MRTKTWAAVSAAVLSTAVLGGCSADGEPQAEEIEAPQASTAAEEPSPATPPDDGAPDDAAVCAAFGDVLTIVENADLGLAGGRMEAQERDGWYQLATRVLDRLPSTGGSAVRTAIGELQEIAPAVPAGGYAESTGVRSPEWNDAEGLLGAACDDLGAPLAITVFTGG
ncbi:hypothetical protein N866_15215 [Actinotalea ferrariae CF5-4]|uniref:Lipoprotein n=1 Tax=Actinotalea ferrariae CF5-4 TaxID=948458 RepID=A0A021VVA2_9CELL|nr:hypothetical protein [Actinotalea ferrariae]EYR65091.1 hypothetical protein N866_15215 [Actinotalea ferrariae CF5-4]